MLTVMEVIGNLPWREAIYGHDDIKNTKRWIYSCNQEGRDAVWWECYSKSLEGEVLIALAEVLDESP